MWCEDEHVILGLITSNLVDFRFDHRHIHTHGNKILPVFSGNSLSNFRGIFKYGSALGTMMNHKHTQRMDGGEFLELLTLRQRELGSSETSPSASRGEKDRKRTPFPTPVVPPEVRYDLTLAPTPSPTFEAKV